MSISAAYNASRSGLVTTARWAEVTSTNIANAGMPGYARRVLGRSTAQTGVVMVSGLQRQVDTALDRMYRRELSRTMTQQTLADGLQTYTDILGDTDNEAGLSAQLIAFQTSFDMLANAPGDTTLQRNAVEAANTFAQALNRTSGALDTAAANAVEGVRNDVLAMNQTLSQIRDLNKAIHNEPEGTTRRAALEDQIAQKLDGLAEIADIQIRRDSFGRVDVSTAGGIPLIEGDEIYALEWNPATQTLSAGGIDITPGIATARGFEEGSLAGRITLVRETLPKMRLQLDELARAVIQGFEATDSSLSPGMAGLFTDAGGAFSGSVTGLAGRIAVNDAVKPQAGGALWRMRDGIGATVEGPASDNAQVLAFRKMMDGSLSFDPAADLGPSRTLNEFISGLVSSQQNERVSAEQANEGFVASLQAIETSRESIQGVNLDDELLQLSDIEQAYNANSQVLRTLSEMIDSLLAAVA